MLFELDEDALRRDLERELPSTARDATGSEIHNGDECRVFRLEAAGAALVVRVHPDRHRADRVRWTHELARHLGRSVPEVVAPMRFASGDSVVLSGPHPVSLFPWGG